MSSLSFFWSSTSIRLVGVSVRLYLPAVTVEKTIPAREEIPLQVIYGIGGGR